MSAWNPRYLKSTKRAPWPSPTIGTIWDAQGFRVQLFIGLNRTTKWPTSVPTPCSTYQVSCAAGRGTPVTNFLAELLLAASGADDGARAIGADADAAAAMVPAPVARSQLPGHRQRSQIPQHRQWSALTMLAVVTRARETAPIPARSDADRPAPAGWAALRLLADVDISF